MRRFDVADRKAIIEAECAGFADHLRREIDPVEPRGHVPEGDPGETGATSQIAALRRSLRRHMRLDHPPGQLVMKFPVRIGVVD